MRAIVALARGDRQGIGWRYQPEWEVSMNSTDAGRAAATDAAKPGTIDMGLEVVTLPVSNVDRVWED
jgi:hypothetical protein